MNSNKHLTLNQNRKIWSFSKGALIMMGLAIFCLRLPIELPMTNAFQIEALVIFLALVSSFARFTVFPAVNRKFGATIFDLYVLALALLVPFLSAWQAYLVFDQPMVHGILTQRSFWLLGLVLLLVFWIRIGTIRENHISRTLLTLAWLWLAFTIFLYLFAKPESFVKAFPTFATGNERHGFYYRFDFNLLIFGIFYYFIKGFFEKKFTAYILGFIFLTIVLAVFDKRSANIALLLALIWTMSVVLNKRRIIEVYTKLLITVILIGTLIIATIPERVINVIARYDSAFSALFYSKVGEDISSNARISEFGLIQSYIKKNWIFGNGDLSSQWNDGFIGNIGYFYPSDLGVIGVFFVYGLVGTSFLYVQFLFLRYRQDVEARIEDRALYASCYAITVFLLLQSVIKGGIMFSPAVTLFFIAVVRGINSQNQLRLKAI